MTSFTKTALAALMTGVLGLSALPATAMAQDQQQQPQVHRKGGPELQFRLQMPEMGKMRGGQRGGVLNLVCSENGAERLEIAFVRLSHRLALTAEQQPLFDDLKATALTAQTGFADKCAAARPADTAKTATPPNMVDALKTRIDLDGARLEALNTVLPKLEALYGALTDTQKAALQPRQHNRDGMQKQQGQPPAPAPADAPDGSEG